MTFPATSLLLASEATPAAAPAINAGDTAWVLTATTLVLMMTLPGLFLFYGGLVRSKNVLSTIMHSVICSAVVGVLWVLCGYSISFGDSSNPWWGGLANAGLDGLLGTTHPLAPTIPAILFVAFQGTFAVITPALISGAVAERVRFAGFTLFIALWSLLIYAPLCHWVWGGGWIGAKVGALDFAGGTVVHIASGVAALVCAVFLGKRSGYTGVQTAPHSLPLTATGAGLLWVGWFGFNAGSALGSGELAAVALINTNTAAAGAALSWLAVERVFARKVSLLGALSGAVAGLVVITPAAGFVTPLSALSMGLIGGAACCAAVALKPRLGYDDTLDVVGVHLVGGVTGSLLTGLFADKAVNAAIPALSLGTSGGVLATGEWTLMTNQALAVGATLGFCAVGTLVLLVLVNRITPLRASAEEESAGLDLSQHDESAYAPAGHAVQVPAHPQTADERRLGLAASA